MAFDKSVAIQSLNRAWARPCAEHVCLSRPALHNAGTAPCEAPGPLSQGHLLNDSRLMFVWLPIYTMLGNQWLSLLPISCRLVTPLPADLHLQTCSLVTEFNSVGCFSRKCWHHPQAVSTVALHCDYCWSPHMCPPQHLSGPLGSRCAA